MPQLSLPQSCRLELSFEIKQTRQINALPQVQSPRHLHNIIEHIFLFVLIALQRVVSSHKQASGHQQQGRCRPDIHC